MLLALAREVAKLFIIIFQKDTSSTEMQMVEEILMKTNELLQAQHVKYDYAIFR